MVKEVSSRAKTKREAMVKVLQMFKKKDQQAWSELCKNKEKEVSYPTLKKVVERLVKAGLMKVSIGGAVKFLQDLTRIELKKYGPYKRDEIDLKKNGLPYKRGEVMVIEKYGPYKRGEVIALPLVVVNALIQRGVAEDEPLARVFTLLVPVHQVLYLNNIISFLEKQFDKWRFSQPLPEGGYEGHLSSVLVSDIPWKQLKKYITPEDDLKIREAQDSLLTIQTKMVLDTFSEDKRKQIHMYEHKVKELIITHRPFFQEVLRRSALRSPFPGETESEKLREKKMKETFLNEFERFTNETLMLNYKQIEEVFSNIATQEPDPQNRAKLEPIFKGIIENGDIYEKYKRQRWESKILLAMGHGFGVSAEEYVKLEMMLPLEWLDTPQLKDDLKFELNLPWIKKDLESFEESSVQQRCVKCLELFRKKSWAEDHVRRIHFQDDVDSCIEEVDKSFYQELQELHEKTFPPRPTVEDIIRRSDAMMEAAEGKDS